MKSELPLATRIMRANDIYTFECDCGNVYSVNSRGEDVTLTPTMLNLNKVVRRQSRLPGVSTILGSLGGIYTGSHMPEIGKNDE
jgi:hypothetical protein